MLAQRYRSNEVSNNENNNETLAFNLSEIDAEYFPMKQFRKYARDAFEDDQLSLLQW